MNYNTAANFCTEVRALLESARFTLILDTFSSK